LERAYADAHVVGIDVFQTPLPEFSIGGRELVNGSRGVPCTRRIGLPLSVSQREVGKSASSGGRVPELSDRDRSRDAGQVSKPAVALQ